MRRFGNQIIEVEDPYILWSDQNNQKPEHSMSFVLTVRLFL